jgi:hypothetical protein
MKGGYFSYSCSNEEMRERSVKLNTHLRRKERKTEQAHSSAPIEGVICSDVLPDQGHT